MTDRNGNQDSDTVYVRIEDLSPETFQIPPAAHTVVNYPEGAEAFPENTRVTPDGSGSNDSLDNGRIVSYLWEQIGLTGGTLSNATRSRATFTTPPGLTADAGYRFFLTVVDSDCLTATGEAFVRVKAANAVKRPTAHAGPDQTNKRICHDRV